MKVSETSNFGQIGYEADSIIEFPRGLPGFEARRAFVLVQLEQTAPLVFLQSLEEPTLCFSTMPIRSIDPAYRLRVAEEDLALVGLPTERPPIIGDEVLCLCVLAIREGGPTANLLAPVVVNLLNRKAVQAIAPGSEYSCQQALFEEEAAAVCS